MITKTITVQSETGLHARPASQLVALIRNFKSEIKIINAPKNIEANAKSMINLLTLGAQKGVELQVQCEGPDEAEALEVTSKFLSEFTD